MKRAFIVCLGLTIFVAAAVPVQAQSPTPTPASIVEAVPVNIISNVRPGQGLVAMRAAINLDAAFIVPLLRLRQELYKRFTGRYFQGLRTHDSIPANGNAVLPGRYLTHPTDQTFTWSDLRFFQYANLPYSMTIDTYDGPAGKGYALTITITISGAIWERTWNEGGETWRATDWRQVVNLSAGDQFMGGYDETLP